MEKEIKEQIEEVEEEVEVDRSRLNIQQFMLDMHMLNDQIRDRNVVKPVFDYGASEVTNYLLWLILGELTILNNKLEED